MALSEQEWRLAEALAIQKNYGDQAASYVAERIGELALAGDHAGVERWKQIAAQLDELLRSTRQ